MAHAREHVLTGTRGALAVREWPHGRPRYLALVAHGYGEHAGRYEELADTLVAHGAAVFAADHMGHGKSAGERALIEDFEEVVTDLRAVAELARSAYPDPPVVLTGHSMGGLVAARYAQRYGGDLAALVLSGPVIGAWETPARLLAAAGDHGDLPDVRVGPAALSRDPAVGAAYAADPLVWHGPMKRPTAEAFVRALRTVSEGGDTGRLPLLWLHGEDDRLVPVAASRPGVEALSGGDPVVRIYPGARHEVFNETGRELALADMKDFLDTVLDGG
ncbi:lysophospholipase [Streptomyces sp. NPDC085946]|uniref:lysophospholipase n=1 Tax=Streptomyces sp. NPDC085946 TaxID=3365744 RepID=UPI0037D611BD